MCHEMRIAGSGSAGNTKLKTTIIQYDGYSWEELIPNFQGRINALADWNGNLIVSGQIPVGDEGKVVSLAQWDDNNWQEFPGQNKGGGL